MSMTVNAKVYTANSFLANQVGYTGPAKTGSTKDDIILRTTAPKPTPVFSGVVRATAKLTRTNALTGALTPMADGLTEVNVSMPVGSASADIDAYLNDMGAFVASPTFKTFVKNMLINY